MTDDKKTIKRRTKELDLEEKEVGLEKAKLELELTRLSHTRSHLSHGPTLDMHRGIFRLEDVVYSGVIGLSSVMQRWADDPTNTEKPITLYIFSPGGSVFHGFALYDTLRTLSDRGHEVTTVIRGFAGSMASVIFLAGDRRLIGAESIIHQHEGSSGVRGSASEIKDEAAFMQRLEDKITRIYTSRTNITARTFKSKINRKEWYADADEALKLGIATEVA